MYYSEAAEHLRSIGVSVTWTNRVFAGEALKRGLQIEKGQNRRIIVRDGAGRSYTWRGGFTNFNSPLSDRVTRHKDVCSRILSAYGVAATENAAFAKDEPERAWQWARSLGALVVKPVDGTHGADVHVGITEKDRFLEAFDDVARHGRVLVEKFYRGVEHRCLVVNGKLVAATRRRPASILGDGAATVHELVEAKNQDRYPIHSRIALDTEALALLVEQGLTVDSVPHRGQRAYLRRTSNIHQGGDAIDATEDLTPDEVDLVERAARALPGARLLGMDVLLPRDPEDTEARILEINSGPMITMHHYPWEGTPRNAAAAILDAMFPQPPRGSQSGRQTAGSKRGALERSMVGALAGSSPIFRRARKLVRRILRAVGYSRRSATR